MKRFDCSGSSGFGFGLRDMALEERHREFGIAMAAAKEVLSLGTSAHWAERGVNATFNTTPRTLVVLPHPARKIRKALLHLAGCLEFSLKLRLALLHLSKLTVETRAAILRVRRDFFGYLTESL
jgi:hypothetical protein